MTPRSLVGMTMGARKRAWGESRTLYSLIFPHGIKTDDQEMIAGYSWSEIRTYWKELGQRLRPCPDCKKGPYLEQFDLCDGSGVLPARAKKVRR